MRFFLKFFSIYLPEITDIPEYYLTKCELSILKERSESFVSLLKPETIIMEFGSGSSKKTRTFLEAFLKVHQTCTYVPIDISREILLESANALLSDYKGLKVTAMHGSYDDALKYIKENLAETPKLLMFLGSSVGNLDLEGAISFLNKIRESINFFQ